jgi:predicted TIM-barrel fold metal-dependent hydrolase
MYIVVAKTMMIDCHAHFEPRMLNLAGVLAKMDAVGVDRVALIPCMNDPLPETPELLLTVIRKLMASRPTRPLAEVVHRLTLTRHGNLRLGRKVYNIYPRPDNQSVADVVAAHPDRFYGWIFLNPRSSASGVPQKNAADQLAELERWRAVRGMIGIKLHPHWHDYETDLLDPILRRAEELRLPVLIHLGFGRRGDFRAICDRFPKLTVISAHAGFPFYKDLWAYGRAYPHLHVDLSSPYIDEALARAAVAKMGPERCLYGTDAPYGFHRDDGSYDYGAIKSWVERLPVPSAKRDAIFGDNFLQLVS